MNEQTVDAVVAETPVTKKSTVGFWRAAGLLAAGAAVGTVFTQARVSKTASECGAYEGSKLTIKLVMAKMANPDNKSEYQQHELLATMEHSMAMKDCQRNAFDYTKDQWKSLREALRGLTL